MSNLFSLVRRAPKRFIAAALMLAAVIAIPAMGNAWGPSRDTFTQAHPADHITFNSITDNPQVGDERNFVRIKEDGASEYVDGTTLTPGKVYDVSVYFHNNAAANLNLVAKDVTLKMEVPQVVTAGVNAAFTGTISSSNSTPLKVWDEAYGKNATNSDILLRYVSNSATVVSNGAVNGAKLSDSLFTTGAKLGYNKLDGNLPGCNQFAGFVNFKIRVDQPNFDVKKVVSTDNGKTWANSVNAAPGQTILYGLSYQNTGTNQQDDVVVRDILPKNVTYVKDSTYILNSVTNGQYKKTLEGITTSGLNAGSYQPKGNVFYKFSAKLPSADQLECGKNTIVNTVRVTTNAGYKEAQATVTVNKECKPPVTIKVCDLNTKKIITIDEKDFDSSKYSKNFDDCKEVVKSIKVCELDTKKIVTINEKDFDSSKYSKNFDDCKTTVELPHAGISENIFSILGVGSLVASTIYYLASRRN